MEQLILSIIEEGNNLQDIITIARDIAEPSYIGKKGRIKPKRNHNYYEITIKNYSAKEFKDHFRMTRSSFSILKSKIGETDVQHNVPLEKQLLFTLWLLAKPESFLSAGYRFDIAKSSGHHIFKSIVKKITNLSKFYLKWPTIRKCEVTAQNFEKISGIPGVVGAIGVCHIPIKQPVKNPNSYYNKKGFHSIILQGTCDSNMIFTDVFIGMPGGAHDAEVFRTSTLYRKLMNNNTFIIPENSHVIGDSAYPLMDFIIIPYNDNGQLSRQCVQFNEELRLITSSIKRAFGFLKGKFRRLKYLDVSDLDLAVDIIYACCILHNFLITTESLENYIESNLEEAIDLQNDNVPADLDPDIIIVNRRELGDQKRQLITETL